MKKVVFLLLVLVTNLCFSQKKAMSFIPLLFDTSKVNINDKRERIEIKDSLLNDTLKIGFKVMLEFKYPINDTSKPICLNTIVLKCLEIKSFRTKKQYSIEFIRKNKWNRYKRDIWNRYSEILNYWYKNQPYEKMIYRQEYGDKGYFGGVLYAVP